MKQDHLPHSIKGVEKVFKEYYHIIENSAKFQMFNPVLAKIMDLPKIHKHGNESPEIIAATNSPTKNIAKWLLARFNELGGLPAGNAIRNREDLIKKLKDVEFMTPNERLVSFDVEDLFPSIPVSEALLYLKKWLLILGVKKGTG